MITVEDAIVGRQSIRAFDREKPVPRQMLERILTLAGRAPSGSNIQPWRVYVLQGRTRDTVCTEMLALHDAGVPTQREYDFYPRGWRTPYKERRRECGLGLYGVLKLGREDKAGMHAQLGRNYVMFDAPVGLVITIDRDMEHGSWLDCGMFIQTAMLAARALGLETCPQAAIANYQQVLRKHLPITDNEIVVCGVAIGYPKPGEIVNTFRTTRAPLGDFAHWSE